MGEGITRRRFMAGMGAAVLSALPVGLVDAVTGRRAEAAEAHYFFDAHQYATVDALCRRLIPGPEDDPTEPDPGAGEANVVAYVDLLLGAFNLPAPLGPRIWGAGPFSGRAGPPPWPFDEPGPRGVYGDDFARSAPLSASQVLSWRTLLEGTRGLPERRWADVAAQAGGAARFVGLQETYVNGVVQLDQAAAQMFPPAKSFVELSGPEQDLVINRPDLLAGFVATAFQNACEGMYGAPEYGGNRNRVGWTYIGFPGDSQPRGYTAADMLAPDTGPPITAAAVDLTRLRSAARALGGVPRSAVRPWIGGRGL
ncbi:MAG TPA: gluconate 2-dehydrogenase subunit 3 family protein [Acidimicrobiales bacterium]|nr:gluconate 2-dehydrogenase subunit 3 family protein [Acidimicrobiales bacterium]